MANKKKLGETAKILLTEKTPKGINLHVKVFNVEEIEKIERYTLYLKKQKDSTIKRYILHGLECWKYN